MAAILNLLSNIKKMHIKLIWPLLLVCSYNLLHQFDLYSKAICLHKRTFFLEIYHARPLFSIEGVGVRCSFMCYVLGYIFHIRTPKLMFLRSQAYFQTKWFDKWSIDHKMCCLESEHSLRQNENEVKIWSFLLYFIIFFTFWHISLLIWAIIMNINFITMHLCH